MSMMAERPAPRLIVATIAVMQDRARALDALMLGTTGLLVGTMAARVLAAWIAS